RSACQRWVMRRAYGMTKLSILTVPLQNADWLPPRPAKAVFAPVGSNVPQPPPSAEIRFPKKTKRAVSVFAITDQAADREIEELALIANTAARAAGSFQLMTFGRGSAEAEGRLRRSLNGATVDFACLGVLPPEDVSNRLAQSDVLLFSRGPLTCQRGSA